ncbi:MULTISPECIES: DUF3016 domain-containing protein [Delftia]|uniref:DUF3016 domain-containing protein n=1 Tax=Delftia lacustris TaxID=558537 RepID=A0A7T3DDI9_9BURK|nr:MULTISPECIES: DUF3016 domain-containing protein [Delftia]EPD35352.1 hypothetical protein HMPREF9702_05970 [Delftia acidovorans CCUG 15835]KAA9170553.1 DUF3016 domain-containing protein [Delftia sp. BR1]QPS79553.1 DUF3016 domain-containing protein [Delftia lacustris]
MAVSIAKKAISATQVAPPARRRWMCMALGAACLGMVAGCAVQGPEQGRPDGMRQGAVLAGIVSVTFDDPSRFDAGRNGTQESEKARRAWVDALAQFLAERAAPRLPQGQRLEVHLTDVQRAGSFEPWRGPQAADVRIVRDIYPPRIDLRFKLLDADGKLLREGSRQLRDATFMMRPDLYPNDPLRYEKTLLDDWLRAELPK